VNDGTFSPSLIPCCLYVIRTKNCSVKSITLNYKKGSIQPIIARKGGPEDIDVSLPPNVSHVILFLDVKSITLNYKKGSIQRIIARRGGPEDIDVSLPPNVSHVILFLE
ncbi:unnamed protein product, partial [Allacma fusca]